MSLSFKPPMPTVGTVFPKAPYAPRGGSLTWGPGRTLLGTRSAFPHFSAQDGIPFHKPPLTRAGDLPTAPSQDERAFPTAPLPPPAQGRNPSHKSPLTKADDLSHSPSAQDAETLPSALSVAGEGALLLRASTLPLPTLPAADPPSRSSMGSSSQPVVQITARAPAFLAGAMLRSCSLGVPPRCATSQPSSSYLNPG